MKYCEEYGALISAWLDGELNEADTRRLQAHLFTCPGCRAYLADLKAMSRAFPPLEEVEVPEDFTASVMARIRAQAPPEKKKASPALWRRWGAWACCLALLVLVGGGVWRADLVSHSMKNQAAAADVASLTTGTAGAESDGSGSAQAAPEDTAPAQESVQEDTARSDAVFESQEVQSRDTGEEAASGQEKTVGGAAQSPAADSYTAPETSQVTQRPQNVAQAPEDGGLETSTSPEEETAAQNGVLSWRVSLTVPQTAADLLAGFTPQETDEETGQAVYYLSEAEYETLSSALESRGIGAEETAGDSAASLIRVVLTP